MDRNSKEYWQQRLSLTTECPVCHKNHTRDIHPEELRNYQVLVMCKECENNGSIVQ